jgi:hypothetical protein
MQLNSKFSTRRRRDAEKFWRFPALAADTPFGDRIAEVFQSSCSLRAAALQTPKVSACRVHFSMPDRGAESRRDDQTIAPGLQPGESSMWREQVPEGRKKSSPFLPPLRGLARVRRGPPGLNPGAIFLSPCGTRIWLRRRRAMPLRLRVEFRVNRCIVMAAALVPIWKIRNVWAKRKIRNSKRLFPHEAHHRQFKCFEFRASNFDFSP